MHTGGCGTGKPVAKGRIRMKKIVALIITIAIMLSVLVSGCTGQATDNTKKQVEETKLVVGTTAQVDSISLGDGTMQLYRLMMLSPGLVRIDEKGDTVGVLAESWETPDNQKWTFHLVKNATFHDGTPVTSGDLKFTLEYMPRMNFSSYKSEWQLIDTIETPDDYTLVINLKKPSAAFMTSMLIMRTLPQHIYKDVDAPKNFTNPKGAIGCGPYKFESFDKDAGVITFRAYDEFFMGKPAVDVIEIRSFKNPDTMVMALQKGEIDVTYIYAGSISYYYVPKLLQNDDIKFLMVKNLGIPKVLWINNDIAPYNDAKFREALSHAINYEELKNLFAAGYGRTPNGGFVPEGTFNYVETSPLTYDINKTKELMAGAGYKDTDGDGYFNYANGTELKPIILANAGVPDDVRLAEMLQKYFNAAGIEAQAKIVDKSTFDALTYDGKYSEMFIIGTTYFGMQAWGQYGSSYMDSRMYAWSNVVDPEFYSIVDGLLATSNKDEKKRLAEDIQNYYATQYPSLALYWNDLVQPYNKKYEGYVAGPMFGIMSFETFYGLHKAA